MSEDRWFYDGKDWLCSTCHERAAKVSTGGEDPYCANCGKQLKPKASDGVLDRFITPDVSAI